MGDFNGMQGSFHAALKIDFEITLQERPNCGDRQSAPVDLEASTKVHAAGLQPFPVSMISALESGHEQLSQIMAHSVGELHILRGGKEVSLLSFFLLLSFESKSVPMPMFLIFILQPAGLVHSSFALELQMSGEFSGLECLRLDGFGASANGDKTFKLSLGNRCTRDASGCHKIHVNPQDPFCLIAPFKFCTTRHLLPAMKAAPESDHRFFVRRACGKVLKERRGLGLTCEAGPHKNQHWGEGHFPKQIRELAIWCEFNPERHTMHSGQRTGITLLAKSSLGSANAQKAARHQSVEANRSCQEEDESDHVARSKVFHANATGNVDHVVGVPNPPAFTAHQNPTMATFQQQLPTVPITGAQVQPQVLQLQVAQAPTWCLKSCKPRFTLEFPLLFNSTSHHSKCHRRRNHFKAANDQTMV